MIALTTTRSKYFHFLCCVFKIKCLNVVHMDKNRATDRVKALIIAGRSTKVDLSQKLGISRVTLDTRLKKSNWRKGELVIISQL